MDTCQRLGDWEVDAIIGTGHRYAIISLTKRKSRLALLREGERRTAQAVADSVSKLPRLLPDRIPTITANDGREFANHERIARELHAYVYFAHPAHPGSEPPTKT